MANRSINIFFDSCAKLPMEF